jgi:hypothetical protein
MNAFLAQDSPHHRGIFKTPWIEGSVLVSKVQLIPARLGMPDEYQPFHMALFAEILASARLSPVFEEI